jgi:hypothetical protein
MTNAERQRRYRRRQRRELRELAKNADKWMWAVDQQERKHAADIRKLARVARRLRRAGNDASAMLVLMALLDRWPELPDEIKRQLADAKDIASIEALLRSQRHT